MPKINLLTRYESHIGNLRVPLGHAYVTQREYQCINLYANGLQLRQVAKAMRISEKTVSSLIARAKERTGAATIPALVHLYSQELKRAS